MYVTGIGCIWACTSFLAQSNANNYVSHVGHRDLLRLQQEKTMAIALRKLPAGCTHFVQYYPR